VPRLEELRDAWFDAPDLPAQQAIARDMQTVAMDELPYIPLGSYKSMTALRANLTGRVAGLAIYWGSRRGCGVGGRAAPPVTQAIAGMGHASHGQGQGCQPVNGAICAALKAG
jgi:hypothetical protein